MGTAHDITGLTETLLNTETYPGGLLSAVQQLYALLCDAAGIDDDRQTTDLRTQTMLPTGKAVSPLDAGRCVLDSMRTATFFRGVVAAVEDARRLFPGTPLRVLYAGSGPFAALMLPLVARYSPAQVQVTLIDIHDYSLHTAREIHRRMGWTDFVQEYICGDAVVRRFDTRFHLLITETMLRALEKEPQVAVTASLSRYLHPGGLLVPQNIRVDARMANPANEFHVMAPGSENEPPPENYRKRVMIGPVMDVNLETVRAFPREFDGGDTVVPLTTLSMPADTAGFPVMMLFTHIQVYGPHQLGEYQSGLTNPLILEMPRGVRGGDLLRFSYRFSSDPRILCAMSPGDT